MRRALLILLLLPLLLGLRISYSKLESIEAATLQDEAYTRNEVMLFPEGKALKAISFGFNNFASNILWFKTISYFGKHFKGDRNYKWLEHMCGVVFELDPHAKHVPEFCGLMLAWEASDPEAAVSFLDAAIEADPDYWRYYYLRGITNILFLKDPETAKSDFLLGSKTPGAPVFMTRLATKTLANLEDPNTAIAFLKGMVKRAKDPNEKETLERHLRQTIHDANIVKLEEAVTAYREREGNFPKDLKEVVSDETSLKDPYGGLYFWDSETEAILSTSGRKKGKVMTDAFLKKTKGKQH